MLGSVWQGICDSMLLAPGDAYSLMSLGLRLLPVVFDSVGLLLNSAGFHLEDGLAKKFVMLGLWELFLSEVNNREAIAAMEANNDTFCLHKRIEKFLLVRPAPSKLFGSAQVNTKLFIHFLQECIRSPS